MPQVYPDSVLQVILSAYQRINRSATLADINRDEFGGTYMGLYQSVNMTKSACYTGFVDLMRGVSNNTCLVTRAEQQEHFSNRENYNNNYNDVAKHSKSSKRVRKNASRVVARRRQVSLFLARSFRTSNLPLNPSLYVKNDPNKLSPAAKSDFVKNVLNIDRDWTPREGVYTIEGTNEEDEKFKTAIVKEIRAGKILAEAILKSGKYVYHFTPMALNQMKLVNGHSGELLDKLDCFVWLCSHWEAGFERMRVRQYGEDGVIPIGTKFCVCIFFPSNVYHQSARQYMVCNCHGKLMAGNHHYTSIISGEIGDAWLELEWRGIDVAPGVEVLEWNPPDISIGPNGSSPCSRIDALFVRPMRRYMVSSSEKLDCFMCFN